MRPLLSFLTILLLLLAFGRPAQAQSNQFRDTRAHLGVAVGLFTYHGPVDLTQPRSAVNFDRISDPALVILGSFPIAKDRLFFRGMLGFSNFDNDPGPHNISRLQNEFLTQDLFWFEPEIVWTLRPGSRSRILPYVFTGFGGLLADPFQAQTRVDRPGTGVPGPERSVFAIPVGAGIDFGITPMFSFFIEGSWRFDLNYVFRNEANYYRHNTSLIMFGLRLGLRNPFRRGTVQGPEPPIPAPMNIPMYQPPSPKPYVPSPTPRPQCDLSELNSVFFAIDGAALDAEARARLDENVEALRLSAACCIEIVGYTDEHNNDLYALRISQQRAEAVMRYYISQGIAAERLSIRAEGTAFPPCGKEEEGPGCRRNRRVESIPHTCADIRR